VGQPDPARSINGPCLARPYSYRAETGSGRVRAGWSVWTSIAGVLPSKSIAQNMVLTRRCSIALLALAPTALSPRLLATRPQKRYPSTHAPRARGPAPAHQHARARPSSPPSLPIQGGPEAPAAFRKGFEAEAGTGCGDGTTGAAAGAQAGRPEGTEPAPAAWW
jgi:hypothetical protein